MPNGPMSRYQERNFNINAGSSVNLLFSIFQEVINHRGDRRKVLISGRNMHQIWTDGKSIVQLDRF